VNRIGKLTKALKTISPPKNLWNRLFVVILVVAACGLILLSLNGLASKVSGLRPDSNFQGDVITIEPPTVIDVTAPELVSREDCPGCVFVNLEAQHFSPQERLLTGLVHIDIPASTKEKLWSNYEYIVTHDAEYPNNLVLKDAYKNTEITLVTFSSYLANSVSETRIPLGKFFEDPYQNIVSVPFSIKFSGESSSYPGDWYHAENYFSLELPNGMALRETETGFWSILPIKMHVSSNFQIGDFTIRLKRDLAQTTIDTTLEMLIMRDQTTQSYIYAMAFLPLLLSLVFAHSHLTANKNKEKITGGFILEVSAIMFTVLPLRSVLVPSNIEGLVSVDLILGLGIATMMLIAMVLYTREVWKRNY
jgi:hypothetical protein